MPRVATRARPISPMELPQPFSSAGSVVAGSVVGSSVAAGSVVGSSVTTGSGNIRDINEPEIMITGKKNIVLNN